MANAMAILHSRRQYEQNLANASPELREAFQTAITNPQAAMQNSSMRALLLQEAERQMNTPDAQQRFRIERLRMAFAMPIPRFRQQHEQALANASPELREALQTPMTNPQAMIQNPSVYALLMERAEQEVNTPEAQQRLQRTRRLMESSPNAQSVIAHATLEQVEAINEWLNNPIAFLMIPGFIDILESAFMLPGGPELGQELLELSTSVLPPADEGSCCCCFFKWIQNNILDPIWNLFKCIFFRSRDNRPLYHYRLLAAV